MEFRTSVWKAINASDAFHQNFTSFIYQPGKTKGQKRTDPIFKEASDVLSTAVALKQHQSGNDNGKAIKKSGWWCFTWRTSATGSYGKKFPDKTSVWGVATGFKLMSGVSTMDFFEFLLKGWEPKGDFTTSVGLTIGYVPDLPGVGGVRAGVSVGGSITLGPRKVKIGIKLGLGMSAATGNVDNTWLWCGGPKQILSFGCKKSVASAFTIFCKDFNFLNGQNGDGVSDPCATKGRAYVSSHRRRRRHKEYDMPGRGRTAEDTADLCRERCKRISGCKHYSYWPKDGGCHLQNWDSYPSKNGAAWAGSPVCCAYKDVKYEYDNRGRRRQQYDMPGHGRSKEPVMTDCQWRCAKTSGCKHFSYWKDGGCHLSGSNAKEHYGGGITAGPDTCP